VTVATIAGRDERIRDCLPGYPGNKSSEGVWQTIINNIPPHDVWIEAFAGSAVITRRKRPAQASIVIDSDAAVCAALRTAFLPRNAKLVEQFGLADMGEQESILGNVRVIQGEAVKWLQKNRGTFNARTCIYCDPPYLDETLAVPGRSYYAEDFGHRDQHTALLRELLQASLVGARVLLSGYASHLYGVLLPRWRRVDYLTATHGGARTESLWCSFAEPDALHDWRFLGRNFRERERIKRKLGRWRARLAAMPVLERRLIAAALAETGEGDRKL
jgi:16S rRNA G966 N2-methylase RsmD